MMTTIGSVGQGGERMIEVLASIALLGMIGSAAYYAAYRWVNLTHNRDTIADELKRAVEHINDLESRIALMEAEKSLQEYKARPEGDSTGWNAFDLRQQ